MNADALPHIAATAPTVQEQEDPEPIRPIVVSEEGFQPVTTLPATLPSPFINIDEPEQVVVEQIPEVVSEPEYVQPIYDEQPVVDDVVYDTPEHIEPEYYDEPEMPGMPEPLPLPAVLDEPEYIAPAPDDVIYDDHAYGEQDEQIIYDDNVAHDDAPAYDNYGEGIEE